MFIYSNTSCCISKSVSAFPMFDYGCRILLSFVLQHGRDGDLWRGLDRDESGRVFKSAISDECDVEGGVCVLCGLRSA